jgi:hypothetical protein
MKKGFFVISVLLLVLVGYILVFSHVWISTTNGIITTGTNGASYGSTSRLSLGQPLQ